MQLHLIRDSGVNSAKIVLVSHHLCPYVQRAAIALAEKAVLFERAYIDLADKPAWFTNLSPLGKVPLLRVGEEVIFESSVIVEYLEETQPGPLHPHDPLRRAQHRGWIEFSSTVLNAIGGFYNAADGQGLTGQAHKICTLFERLEMELGTGPWFGGGHFRWWMPRSRRCSDISMCLTRLPILTVLPGWSVLHAGGRFFTGDPRW
jgi:glutathione S-transferase